MQNYSRGTKRKPWRKQTIKRFFKYIRGGGCKDGSHGEATITRNGSKMFTGIMWNQWEKKKKKSSKIVFMGDQKVKDVGYIEMRKIICIRKRLPTRRITSKFPRDSILAQDDEPHTTLIFLNTMHPDAGIPHFESGGCILRCTRYESSTAGIR